MRLVEGIAHIDDLDAFLADLDEIADTHGCTVQAFDARYIVGHEHLEQALRLADRAFARNENVARERGVEILLYAAGRRQINRALELGVQEGKCPTVVLVDHESAVEQSVDAIREAETTAADAVASLLVEAPTLDEFDTDRVTTFYDITDVERQAVAGNMQDLVLERVALLDVEK